MSSRNKKHEMKTLGGSPNRVFLSAVTIVALLLCLWAAIGEDGVAEDTIDVGGRSQVRRRRRHAAETVTRDSVNDEARVSTQTASSSPLRKMLAAPTAVTTGEDSFIATGPQRDNTFGTNNTFNFGLAHLPHIHLDAVTKCLTDANAKRWLFTGTSHTRHLYDTFTGVLNESSVFNLVQPFKNAPRNFTNKARGLKLWFNWNPFLEDDVARVAQRLGGGDGSAGKRGKSSSNKVGSMMPLPTVVVLGRFFWDLDQNNTYPHDFYMDLRGQLLKMRDLFSVGQRVDDGDGTQQQQQQQQQQPKIILHMPHSVRDPLPGELPRYQCRRNDRVQMYRRMARCAAHYANTQGNFRESDDPTAGSSTSSRDSVPSAPKVELLDVFEYTSQLSREHLDKAGHHYAVHALHAMVAQLTDRHICPGRNISGAGGFANSDAMAYDRDPWAGVDGDCAEVHQAAAESRLEFGPVGADVQIGQRNPVPPSSSFYNRDTIHMYRNYTLLPENNNNNNNKEQIDSSPSSPSSSFAAISSPSSSTTTNRMGDISVNGFIIRPPPMKAIDTLYQHTFDRLATTCTCSRSSQKFDFTDGCAHTDAGRHMNPLLYSKIPQLANYYCKRKIALEKGYLQQHLPTYMNLEAMNKHHFEEMINALVLMRYAALPVNVMRLCFFNLGVRYEDLSSAEQLQQIREKLLAGRQAAIVAEQLNGGGGGRVADHATNGDNNSNTSGSVGGGGGGGDHEGNQMDESAAMDHVQFVCQCSGVFAPHLMALKERAPSEFNALYNRFCGEQWPALVKRSVGVEERQKTIRGAKLCRQIFTRK